VPELHGLLREHFHADNMTIVVVQRRLADRRTVVRRSGSPSTVPVDPERRLVRSEQGRRIAERRAMEVPATIPVLPGGAAAYAERLLFVERLAPGERRLEDIATARLVVDFQSGDTSAFGAIYMCYHDRIYSWLRLMIGDPQEAEDVAQDVFVQVMAALPRFELGDAPVRTWLFTLARNRALNHLKRSRRLTVVGPSDALWRRLGSSESHAAVSLQLRDEEMIKLVELLPLAQRQVLTLRYMLDFRIAEIGEILERSPEDVRQLSHRALAFMRQRLGPRRSGGLRRERTLTMLKHAPVLQARRFAVAGPGWAQGALSLRRR